MDLAVNDILDKLGELKRLIGEIEAIGCKAIAVPCDVSKEVEVQAMVKQTVETLGGLDVVCVELTSYDWIWLTHTVKMVANAGIMPNAQFILDRK